MVKNTLAALFTEHIGKVSDKWAIYITEYERLFLPYQDQSLRLMEIGIQNGGSLEIWAKYFVNAEKFVGCDINPDCSRLEFDDARIALVVANANSDETQQKIYNLSPSFDIIIDDGSHRSSDIIVSFSRYFSLLNDEGLYIIEDLHCSYWEGFEGGLYQPDSSMAFFKDLADVINFEHWGVDKSRTQFLGHFNRKYRVDFDEIILAHIHSIEFVNSVCVIRKKKPAMNWLGKRLITGTQAYVNTEVLGLQDSEMPKQNQIDNVWANVNPIDELESLQKNIEISNQKMIESSKQYSVLKVTFKEAERSFRNQLSQLKIEHEKDTYEKLLESNRQFEAKREEFEQQSQLLQQAIEQAHVDKTALIMDMSEKERIRTQEQGERERELRERLSTTQEEMRELLALAHDWEKICIGLSSEIKTMQQSISWRITSPMRTVANWFFTNKEENTKIFSSNTQNVAHANGKSLQSDDSNFKSEPKTPTKE